jgi:Ulp1 family protease
MYDFIFIPICIPQGRHWLLASIDVQKREMQEVRGWKMVK